MEGALPDGIKSQRGKFTDAQLKELAHKPNTVVYVHKFDAPEGTMTPQQQIDVYLRITRGFDAGCKQNKHASDEALREKVLRFSEEIRKFQRLYNKVFAQATTRARTAEEERRLDSVRKLTMHAMLERAEGKDTEEEQQARVAYNAMRLAMRPATAKELKSVGNDAIDVSDPAIPEALRKMKPLDPSHYGPSTIKQR
jgi:hypothetical protein